MPGAPDLTNRNELVCRIHSTLRCTGYVPCRHLGAGHLLKHTTVPLPIVMDRHQAPVTFGVI